VTTDKNRKAKGASKVPGVPDKMLPDVERLARERAQARAKKAAKPCKPGEARKGKAVTPTCDDLETAKPRAAASLRTRAAGFFLILVLILGALNAASVVYEGLMYKTPEKTMASSSGSLYGHVTDTKGLGIGGVDVSLVGTTHKATTDIDGWYFIGSVTTKEYRIQADKANYTSIIKRIKVEEQMPRPVNFQLSAGSGVKAADTRLPDKLGDLQSSYAYSALVNLVGAIAVGIGAYLSFKRIRFRTAILCAVLGTLTYGFMLGSFLAVLALLLIIAGRPGFHPTKAPLAAKAKAGTKATVEDAEEITLDTGEGAEVQIPDMKTLGTRRAEQEIGAAEGEARAPPVEETIQDAEVKEKLMSKGLESEGTATDLDGEILPKRKKREIKPVGPEVVGDMERALKETMASQEDTETDIVASVLKKLDLDKPVPRVLPPKEAPKRKHSKVHEERLLCRVCVKPIILEDESVKCKCGRTYHIHCAKNIGDCKNCGRRLKV